MTPLASTSIYTSEESTVLFDGPTNWIRAYEINGDLLVNIELSGDQASTDLIPVLMREAAAQGAGLA